MWAEKWTIMQEASGSSTALNAARRISCGVYFQTKWLLNGLNSEFDIDADAADNCRIKIIEAKYEICYRIIICCIYDVTLHIQVSLAYVIKVDRAG